MAGIMPEDLTIGLDIGGTKMAFALADRAGNIQATQTLPSQSEQGPAAMLDRIAAELNRYLASYANIRGLGIGLPGPVDAKRGLALQAANLGWRNLPIRAAIRQRLQRDLPIYVENDVNAGAIGEGLFGIGQGSADYVYLTVGTGVGGAVMLDKRLLRGAAHSEMEIGHVSLDPLNGRRCACGQRGCLEMSLSGNGIVANARQQLANFPTTKLRADSVSTRALIKLAENQDPLACFVMDEAATALGIACAWCASLFNPRLIILGGGLIHASYHLLQARARAELQARCLPLNHQALSIKLAKLRDAALGASALVWYHQRLET